jgi:RNA polymerase sporulation-specific sigma factor
MTTLATEVDVESMIETHQGLVHKQVNQFMRRRKYFGLEESDLTQAGLVGLVHAIRTFDPDRGAKFATWAWPQIRGAITKAIRKSCRKREFLDEDGVIPSVADPRSDPEEENSPHDLRHDLHRAIAHLPERLRQVTLGRLQGRTGGQIAVEMGVTRQWVSVLQQRALAQLRVMLGVRV